MGFLECLSGMREGRALRLIIVELLNGECKTLSDVAVAGGEVGYIWWVVEWDFWSV